MFDRLEAGVSEIVEEHADLAAVLHKEIFQDDTAQHAAFTAMKAVLSKLAHGALPGVLFLLHDIVLVKDTGRGVIARSIQVAGRTAEQFRPRGAE